MKTELYLALQRIAKASAHRGKYAQIDVETAPFQFQVSDRDFIDCGGGWQKFSGQQLLDAGFDSTSLRLAGYTLAMLDQAGFEIPAEDLAAEAAGLPIPGDTKTAVQAAPENINASPKFICPACAGKIEMRNFLELNDTGFCAACNITWDITDLAPADHALLVKSAKAKITKKMTGRDEGAEFLN